MADVLLVEDEADVAELVQEALEEAGLTVAVVHNDQGAYERLEREARSFTTLVADINLGAGTTGFDVARRARALNPDLKVVYITGHAAHLDRFGVEDALMFPKPFDPVELADQVTMIMGRARRRA
ncbi:response regulator [Phenylobacterium sp. VNQ135]|uniref:response regulator n=1 Tax=Phenylobacterium sp. VNQ135 TaxID=3400922 RepID=UPI003C12365F